MKIGCICGNVLRDQTDYIPFKAWYIADQDLEDVACAIGRKLSSTENKSDPADLVYSALLQNARTVYQCRNCGRLFADDPEGGSELQVFRPEGSAWKMVFASSKRESAKPWARNLVAHWNPISRKGQLWFDPAPLQSGGYEKFDERGHLEKRYYELFDSMRSDGSLVGARFGVGGDGTQIEDIHSWRSDGK